MTITAVTEPEFVPPRVGVTVAVPTDNIMNTVSVWRSVAGVRELIRTQPITGLEERTVYDYECPRGVPVSYVWESEFYDPADNASTFTEPFTSWPGTWTGDTGSGSISSNRLTLVQPFKTVTRAAAFEWDRITIAYLDAEPLVGFPGLLSPVYFNNGADEVFLVHTYLGNLVIDAPGAVSVVSSIDATQPFTIERVDGGFVVSGTGGSATISAAYAAITSITVTAALSDVVLGAVSASTIATTDTLAEESADITLDIEEMWIVNPSTPGLSVPVFYEDLDASTIAELGEVVQPANATLHRPIGSALAVSVSAGPRYGDEFPMVIATETAAEEAAFRALLAKQIPLLILVPPSWSLGLADGFYAVGDVRIKRAVQEYGEAARLITLPLTAAESPVADVENPGWSWAQLAAEFPTWAEVVAAFESWADVASNNRRPGY